MPLLAPAEGDGDIDIDIESPGIRTWSSGSEPSWGVCVRGTTGTEI